MRFPPTHSRRQVTLDLLLRMGVPGTGDKHSILHAGDGHSDQGAKELVTQEKS